MNRYLFLAVSIFYLINQANFVLSSSGGSWGSSPSKLNLGVWLPPMTLRLPKINMPKIKISATIKPRKNQPPMKIHLPEMSLNAKALGDDDNYGSGGNSYSGGGSSYGGGGDSGGYSSGGSGGYSSGGSGGYSSGGGGGDGYSSGGGGESYPSGGNTYADGYSSNSGGGYSYRASASNQNNQNNYQAAPQSNNEPQYQSAQQSNYNNNANNEYGTRYQAAQQDQRNAYYVDNQQSPARPTESVSYGASNSVQHYRPERTGSYRSSSSGVQPLSNYIKRDKAQGNSAYGYGVNSNYARFARN